MRRTLPTSVPDAGTIFMLATLQQSTSDRHF